MKNSTVGLTVVAALVAGASLVGFPDPYASDEPGVYTNHEILAFQNFSSVATPAGITIQPLGKAQGYGLDKESATMLPRDQIAFTDASGMTLYTYAQDPVGQSVCVDECALVWPPALAAPDSRPEGNWSVILRDDGSAQWAFHGKPVYTYIEDVDIGSVAGNSPKLLSRGPNAGPRGSYSGPRPEVKELQTDWTPALLYPASYMEVPVGLTVREVLDAKGVVLVNRADNRTLYTFNGDPNDDSNYCRSPCEWQPLAAPAQASVESESFSFLYRDDGVRQWMWKGRGLYTNANDYARNDANGMDDMWQVAKVLSYYMPENVGMFEHPRLGKILTTLEGKSLYRREGFIFKSGSGHSLHRGVPHRPAVGRDIGVEPRCTDECEKWSPFLAPENAEPNGYWDVYDRPDGSRQWSYQGYALWMYEDDRRPGDLRAHDKFDVVNVSRRTNKTVEIGTPYDGAAALYWHAATP